MGNSRSKSVAHSNRKEIDPDTKKTTSGKQIPKNQDEKIIPEQSLDTAKHDLRADLFKAENISKKAQQHCEAIMHNLEVAQTTAQKTKNDYRKLKAKLDAASETMAKAQEDFLGLTKSLSAACETTKNLKASIDETRKTVENEKRNLESCGDHLDTAGKAIKNTEQDHLNPITNPDVSLVDRDADNTRTEIVQQDPRSVQTRKTVEKQIKDHGSYGDNLDRTAKTAEQYAHYEVGSQEAGKKMEKQDHGALRLDISRNTLQKNTHKFTASLDEADKAVKKVEEINRNLASHNEKVKIILISDVEINSPVDYRMTEDISKTCRPSVIANKYDTLESQGWVDAKRCLEKQLKLEEDISIDFLCAAIMKTYDASCHIYQRLEMAIANFIRQPTEAVNFVEKSASRGPPQLSSEMADAIHAQLQQSCGNIERNYGVSHIIYQDLEMAISELIRRPTQVFQMDFDESSKPLRLLKEMTKAIRTQLQQSFDSIDSEVIITMVHKNLGKHNKTVKELFTHRDLSDYLQQCAGLTWQMVIQQPPMKLSVTDELYDEDRHRRWYSSDGSASNVSRFIWPVLYDGEDGTVFVKGCVATH